MTSKLRELAEEWTSKILGYPCEGGDQHWGSELAVAQRAKNHQRSYIAGFKEGARMAWEAARRRTPIDTDNEITLERLTYLNLNNWLKTMEE